MTKDEDHFIPAKNYAAKQRVICGIPCCSIDSNLDIGKHQGIYLLYNTQNGMPYIGRTICIEGRFDEHTDGRHPSNEKLAAALRHFGKDAFKIYCIETTHQRQMSDAEYDFFMCRRETAAVELALKWNQPKDFKLPESVAQSHSRWKWKSGGFSRSIYNAGYPRPLGVKKKFPVRQWISATEYVDYPSQKFAERITRIRQGLISHCVNRKSRVAGGYPWERIKTVNYARLYRPDKFKAADVRSRANVGGPVNLEQFPPHLLNVPRNTKTPINSNSPNIPRTWQVKTQDFYIRPVRQWISTDPDIYVDYTSRFFAAEKADVTPGSIKQILDRKPGYVSLKGCWWTYVDEEKGYPPRPYEEGVTPLDMIRGRALNPVAKPVRQWINRKEDKYVDWPSKYMAASITEVNATHIALCATGKTKEACGFEWEYIVKTNKKHEYKEGVTQVKDIINKNHALLPDSLLSGRSVLSCAPTQRNLRCATK